MRKILFVLAVVIMGLGQAQNEYYAGGTLGFASVNISKGTFSFGGSVTSISGHFGVKSIIGDSIGLRGGLGILGGGIDLFVDGIFTGGDPNEPFEFYGGGGVRMLNGNGDTAFGVGAFGGGEYYVDKDIGIIGELKFDIYPYRGATINVLKVGLGANFHFADQ